MGSMKELKGTDFVSDCKAAFPHPRTAMPSHKGMTSIMGRFSTDRVSDCMAAFQHLRTASVAHKGDVHKGRFRTEKFSDCDAAFYFDWN